MLHGKPPALCPLFIFGILWLLHRPRKKSNLAWFVKMMFPVHIYMLFIFRDKSHVIVEFYPLKSIRVRLDIDPTQTQYSKRGTFP